MILLNENGVVVDKEADSIYTIHNSNDEVLYFSTPKYGPEMMIGVEPHGHKTFTLTMSADGGKSFEYCVKNGNYYINLQKG